MDIKTKNTSSVETMADLMEQIKNQVFPKVGELIKGTVINIGKNEVILDIDGLTTGLVRGKELEDESNENNELKVGQVVSVTVVDLENERGMLELSLREAGHQQAWDNLETLKKNGEIIKTKIIDANKGGIMCKVGGVIGFMPVSQLTTDNYPRVEGGDKNKILEILKSYIGRYFDAKVIDVDEEDNKLIMSERAAWEDKQKDLISKYQVGQTVKGKVTGVVDFGAFVEFGDNMEGLIHISEIAWQRIDDPRDYIKIGDKVEVKIIEVEGAKISLSLKAMQQDPWKEVVKKYKIGTVVNGKVLKVNDFGAFVKLDKEIHGLAHISELSEYPIKTAGDVVKVGEEYDFKIVSIEPENHRLGLSVKALKEKKRKPETKEKKGEQGDKKDIKKEDRPVKEQKKEKPTKEIKDDKKIKEDKKKK